MGYHGYVLTMMYLLVVFGFGLAFSDSDTGHEALVSDIYPLYTLI